MADISINFRRYISSDEGKARIAELKEEMRKGYKEEADDSLFESAAFYRALTEHGRRILIDGDAFNPKQEAEFWDIQDNYEKKEQYYLDRIRETMPKNSTSSYTLEDFIRGLDDDEETGETDVKA
jgi:hypothetical protein